VSDLSNAPKLLHKMACSFFAGGKQKEPADIIAEDQGGQEFDTNSEKKGQYQADDTSEETSKGEAAEVKDASKGDQGGREFEPLPIKRILVDN